MFVCSHRRSLPFDWCVRQHCKSLESPGLDAAEDARWTRGEGTNTLIGPFRRCCWLVEIVQVFTPVVVSSGDGCRRVAWRETDRHQLLRPNLQTLVVWVMSSWCHDHIIWCDSFLGVFLEEKMFQCFSCLLIKFYILELVFVNFFILNTVMSLQNCKHQNTRRRISIRHQHLIKYKTKTLSQQGALGVWQQTQWLVEWWL